MNNKIDRISKNFRNNQIKGILYIDGKRVLYLKEGVKKKRTIFDLFNDEAILESHINYPLINYVNWQKYKLLIMGEKEYENED